MNIKVFDGPGKCMKGSVLRRARHAADLSQDGLVERMKRWGWYRAKVVKYENSDQFCIDRSEMKDLLAALKRRV